MKTPPATALTGRASPGAVLAKKLASFGNYLRQHWTLYLMLIPGLFFLFIYKLLPLRPPDRLQGLQDLCRRGPLERHRGQRMVWL